MRELSMEEEMMRDYYIKKASGYNVLPKEDELKSAKLKAALQVLTEALKEDTTEGSYYYSWQANIAMAFLDEYNRRYDFAGSATKLSVTANEAAKNFLNQLIK